MWVAFSRCKKYAVNVNILVPSNNISMQLNGLLNRINDCHYPYFDENTKMYIASSIFLFNNGLWDFELMFFRHRLEFDKI